MEAVKTDTEVIGGCIAFGIGRVVDETKAVIRITAEPKPFFSLFRGLKPINPVGHKVQKLFLLVFIFVSLMIEVHGIEKDFNTVIPGQGFDAIQVNDVD